MRRVFLIIGSFLMSGVFLYLFLAGSVWAIGLNNGTDDLLCQGCEPVIHIIEGGTAVIEGSGPAIYLSKTVDLNPQICGADQSLTLPPGGGLVYYCYYVGNTGDVTLNLHTVVDDQIGTLIGPGFPIPLVPGATAYFTFGVNITQTTVNSATWKAFNAGPVDVATASDMALVIVEGPINTLTATNDGPTPLGRETTLGTIIGGGGNETYSWDLGDGITGTGGIISHIYPAVGVYTAVVTATNSFNSLTASTVVTVQQAAYLPVVIRP